MIIIRQKQFGWFGFGKKKLPEQKTPEYKCPSISDLPSNLQQSLRGVERVWKKPRTQELLKKLGKEIISEVTPFMPYLEPRMVEHVHREILAPSMASDNCPDSTLIYPLMWDAKGDWLLCFDITNKKFITINSIDYDFYEEETEIKTLKDYIKDNIKWQVEEKDDFLTMSKDEIIDLVKQIKKAFWI